MEVSEDSSTAVDDLQTLCLYKDSVGENCVSVPSDALFG